MVINSGQKNFLFGLLLVSLLSVGMARAQIPCEPPSEVGGLWHLDFDFLDASPNGNDGVIFIDGAPVRFDDPAPISGSTSSAQSWSDSVIEVPDSDSLDFGPNEDFSIELWFLQPCGDLNFDFNFAVLVTKNSPDNQVDFIGGYRLSVADGDHPTQPGKIGFQIGSGTFPVTRLYVISNNRYNDGQWHHVVAVADRDGFARLYVDGVLDNSLDISALAGLDLSNNEKFVILAREGGQNAFGRVFNDNGFVDEVKLHRKALSSTEVAAIFAAKTEHTICAPTQVCGNDIVEGTEQCDDGNTNDGDGCSAACQIEVQVWEVASIFNARSLVECPSCTDEDNDGFAVEGGECGPIDCNDNNPSQYPGTTMVTDANLPYDNIGECREEISQCEATGNYAVIQEKILPTEEICDGFDNDCNDVIDDAVDLDNDGFNDCFEDKCVGITGQYQGCPYGDRISVSLHIVNLGGNSIKSPLSNVEVKVFDRNSLDFQAVAGSKNPDGSLYGVIFESDAGIVGECITDNNGICIAGESQIGDYLVVVKYDDSDTRSTVYVGRPKSPEDFVNNLASKEFQIIKVFEEGVFQEYRGGSKLVVVG